MHASHPTHFRSEAFHHQITLIYLTAFYDKIRWCVLYYKQRAYQYLLVKSYRMEECRFHIIPNKIFKTVIERKSLLTRNENMFYKK